MTTVFFCEYRWQICPAARTSPVPTSQIKGIQMTFKWYLNGIQMVFKWYLNVIYGYLNGIQMAYK